MNVVADLTVQLKNLQSQKHLLEIISGGAGGSGNGGDGDGGDGGKDKKWINGKHIWDTGHYFWSHGFMAREGHGSATCSKKKEGHKDEATRKKHHEWMPFWETTYMTGAGGD